MAKKIQSPDEEVNAAFEKKEKAEKELQGKQDFVMNIVDDMAETPESLFKNNKKVLELINNFEFKKLSVTMEIDNGKKLTVKLTANSDGKKFITSKVFKP